MIDEEEIKKRLMEAFQGELDEHLETLDKGLLALDRGLPQEEVPPLLDELFRAVHSLKGASRAVGIRDIEGIAHSMEDVVGAIKRGELPIAAGVCDALFSGVDGLRDAMSAHLTGEALSVRQRDQVRSRLTGLRGKEAAERSVEPSEPAVPVSAAAKPPRAGAESPTPSPSVARAPGATTVRISMAKLDALLTGVGQLLNARMRIEQRLTELQDIQVQVAGMGKRWRAKGAHAGPRASRPQGQSPASDIKALNAGVDQFTRHLAHDCDYLSLLTTDLQDEVRRIRMFPLGDLLVQFPRMVRDLAHERNKDVVLETEGADTELDRHVLEAIKDPLTHLLRNAVDHGIEAPDERQAQGKPRQGTIRIRAEQKGDTVALAVADDGRGIDVESVQRVAVERGLITKQQAARQSEREAMDLMFHSGLSTKTQSSEISGRGIGMDVVRKNLESLHGLIGVESAVGEGTTFTMTLPLTVTTTHVLLVSVGGQTVAVPTRNVIRILRLDPEAVGSVEGRPAVDVDAEPVPLVSLARILGFPEPGSVSNDGRKLSVVLLGAVEKRVAVGVDGLRSTQVVVMKALGSQLRRVRNVAGGSILGSGQVVMVLNAVDIIKSSQGAGPVAAVEPAPVAHEIARPRVLVVDDSITTRTLEKNILENAGYEVLVAADGVEACAMAESERLDAIVSDVDMPRMDGFAFTEKIKADGNLKELPVVLVTALHSQEDRLRGLEAGADAYITKGTFDQDELLETMERLIG